MPSHLENTVQIASRLYEARRAARGIMREGYSAKVVEYMEAILSRVTDQRGVLKTGMMCVELLLHANESMAAMLMLAAIVELLEPDGESPVVKHDNGRKEQW